MKKEKYYGWIVFSVIGLAVLIALAAPLSNGGIEWNLPTGSASMEENQNPDIQAPTAPSVPNNAPTDPRKDMSGKKMLVIGDSISAGVTSRLLETGAIEPTATNKHGLINIEKAWWQQVQKRYGIGEVINISYIGACFSQDGTQENYRFTYYMTDSYIPEDLDIILVFGGTNDYGLDRRLGQLTDSPLTANKVTFCSAVKATLEYLTTNFPDAEIVYFTPLPRWAQTGMLLTDEQGNRYIEGGEAYNEPNKRNFLLVDYVNALKSLCEMYDVPVCDLYLNSGLEMDDFEFKMQYVPDGLHPNEEGTDMYVQNAIFPFFDEIWVPNIQ